MYQPPNAADFNVLELGGFNLIQSLQQKKRNTNIDELINAVETTFNDLDSQKVTDVFLTLQNVHICSFRVSDGNAYKLLHLAKPKLRNSSGLTEKLLCDRSGIKKWQNDFEDIIDV